MIREQFADWEGYAQCILAKFRLDCDRHFGWDGDCEFNVLAKGEKAMNKSEVKFLVPEQI